MAASELVLLYQLDPETEKGQKVRNVLRIMKIPVKTITTDQLSQTLGYCANLRGFEPSPETYDGPAIPEEVMIMRDLADQRLNQLLASLRQAAVGKIALKCVVTPHNQGWRLLNLFAELRSENVIMEAFGNLHQTVRLAEAISQKTGQQTGLSQAIAQGQRLLKSKEPPELQLINTALASLRQAIDAARTESGEPAWP